MTLTVRLLGRALFATSLLVVTLPAVAVTTPGGTPARVIPDELIVKFKDSASIVERDAQLQRIGAEPVSRMRNGRHVLLRLPSGSNLQTVIARLEASGLVQYAHPNHVREKLAVCTALAVPHACPNDTNFNIQYHLHNAGLTTGGADSDADMDMPEAWSLITSSSVLLAIVDDGFDLTHPDLDANLRPGKSCNEATDTCAGTAASQGSSEAHGTFVAGTAAAVGNNNSQVTGVMWSADVLPLRMPNYSSEEMILAIDEAILQGAKVINMSFGGPGYDQAEVDAIERARQMGILVVASAGNDSMNIDKSKAFFPTNYPLDNIVSAAASDSSDSLTGFSMWGPFTVEIAAAGGGVLTTELGGGIRNVDGTSFSSPITAGAAALVGQYLTNNGNSTWDYHELKAHLIAGADNASDNGDLPLRGRVAAGRLNVRKSLDLVTGGVLVARGLSFDDSAGDNDGQPDPGETFNMSVQLENVWQSAGTVDATLSTVDTDATVIDGIDTSPLAISAFGTGNVTFQVQLGSFTGNEQILFKLILTPQIGAVQTRYFYLEVGGLRNGVEMAQQIQRTNWDEFHAWHANVPAGATNLVFETHTSNSIDIDLLARRTETPDYMIRIGVNPESSQAIFVAGEESTNPSLISANAVGEEKIPWPDHPVVARRTTIPTANMPGLWNLVVVNYAQSPHVYRIKASWDAAGAGTMRFIAGTTAVNEAAGTLTISVLRSGGVGAVSVDYASASGTATAGSDFTAVSGTLNWANGDTAPKPIIVPITADSATEPLENFTITLSNPTGGADIGRFGEDTVSISDPAPSGGGGGGGGITDPLLLGGLAALLAARRRRMR